MAIHRNIYFLACIDFDRLHRVMSTMYNGESTLDYEEEQDDIWFTASSRRDRIGYMMTTLLNHFSAISIITISGESFWCGRRICS
jgi:hypothetical protein